MQQRRAFAVKARAFALLRKLGDAVCATAPSDLPALLEASAGGIDAREPLVVRVSACRSFCRFLTAVRDKALCDKLLLERGEHVFMRKRSGRSTRTGARGLQQAPPLPEDPRQRASKAQWQKSKVGIGRSWTNFARASGAGAAGFSAIRARKLAKHRLGPSWVAGPARVRPTDPPA